MNIVCNEMSFKVISINPSLSFPDLVFFRRGRNSILWKNIPGVQIGDIIYMYVSKDYRDEATKERHKEIKKERLRMLEAEGELEIEQNILDQRIYYKTIVREIHKKATKEGLYNPTWIEEKDWDKQVEENDNVLLELLLDFTPAQRDVLTKSKLGEYGFRKNQGVNNITENKSLLDYIKKVEDGDY